MLRIGVSACFMYPDPNRLVFGHKTLTYLEKDMSRYLSRPDVQVIMIPDLEGETMAGFLKDLDALVLQGGADLAPESYGEEPIEDGRWKGDRYRDEYEMALIEYFMKQGKPILGICRGFQVLNAYFGGTLYQDIATQRPNSITHRNAAEYDQISHEIEFMPDGLMEEIYGPGISRRVNSIHHQAVKEIGKDLKVLAKCKEDGIIEAFTWTGAEPGHVMGVQWHPEFAYNFKPGGLLEAPKLYDHFLGLCRRLRDSQIPY